ncbi:MAG: amidohydrolase family protein, partial [Longimicrobiales bacterium]
RPDAHFCGGAPIANGYPMPYLPEEIRFDGPLYFLYDDRQADRIPAAVDPAEHTPEAVVARMAQDGAICVKTHYETGFGELSGLPTPTVEMIRALVAAAHARDMSVFLHANAKEAQAFAVSAGADVIAHGMWNGHELHDDALADDVEAILDQVVEDDIGYQPTAQVLHGLDDLFDVDFLSEPRLSDVVPSTLITWYRTEEGG